MLVRGMRWSGSGGEGAGREIGGNGERTENDAHDEDSNGEALEADLTVVLQLERDGVEGEGRSEDRGEGRDGEHDQGQVLPRAAAPAVRILKQPHRRLVPASRVALGRRTKVRRAKKQQLGFFTSPHLPLRFTRRRWRTAQQRRENRKCTPSSKSPPARRTARATTPTPAQASSQRSQRSRNSLHSEIKRSRPFPRNEKLPSSRARPTLPSPPALSKVSTTRCTSSQSPNTG